jgi:hypothetical protein
MFICLLAGASCGPVAPAATSTETTTDATRRRSHPTTKEACDACRGEWALHGIGTDESCICPTHDAGKMCFDSNQCEGQCLVADDATFERMEEGPPPRGCFVGRCSEFDTTFGCYRTIPSDTCAKGPVHEEDASQYICVD